MPPIDRSVSPARFARRSKPALRRVIPDRLWSVASRAASRASQMYTAVVRIPLMLGRDPRERLGLSGPTDVSPLGCQIAYNRFGAYCVPLSARHRPACQRVLRGGVHEPATISFLLDHLGEGDVVHAGTFFGDFLPALSDGCAPGARIWAFEPNAESFRCARITVELNGIRNVQLRQAGLGRSSGEHAFLRTMDDHGRALGGGSRLEPAQVEEGGAMVDIVAIDDIVPDDRHVSIVQLDVEGHEEAALAGAMRTITRCLPVLVVESLPDSDVRESEWFRDNVLALGYTLHSTVHANQVYMRTAGDS